MIGVYPQAWDVRRSGSCVYLHGVGDPSNVGAIVRTADALVDAVIVLGPGCADPYGPKAVRASMGSIFSLPVARGPLEPTVAPRVGAGRARRQVRGDPDPVDALPGRRARGPARARLTRCDRRWTIPLRSGGAESLNVAAAAAIALGRISSAG